MPFCQCSKAPSAALLHHPLHVGDSRHPSALSHQIIVTGCIDERPRQWQAHSECITALLVDEELLFTGAADGAVKVCLRLVLGPCMCALIPTGAEFYLTFQPHRWFGVPSPPLLLGPQKPPPPPPVLQELKNPSAETFAVGWGWGPPVIEPVFKGTIPSPPRCK